MKLDIQGIKNREKEALKILYEAVVKSAQIGTNKIGAEHIKEDVSQEVFILFIDKLIDRFDEQYEAEPWLIRVSQLVAHSMLRKGKDGVNEDIEAFSLEEISVISERNSTSLTEDEIPLLPREQERAMEKIRESMKKAGSGFPGVVTSKARDYPKQAPAQVLAASKQRKKQRELSPTCARLREIRLDLGMTQEAFSDQLGIPTTTLLSYEYGRTPTVRDELMKRAEEIFKEQKEFVRYNKTQSNRPMAEILQEWCDTLSIDFVPEQYGALADALGVDKSTLHRWVNNEMRPSTRALKNYTFNVKNAALIFRKSLKKGIRLKED